MPNALAVVAHYDDHPLFMGATIRRLGLKRWNWTLVAMCIKSNEKRDYFNRFCNQFGANGIAMTFCDHQGGPAFSQNSRQMMREKLLTDLGEKTFDWVFTHSRHPEGEYGFHANHAEVQQVVTSLVDEKRLVQDRGCLAYFSYGVISGHTAATARFDAMEKTHYLQLTYDELLWKCDWCIKTMTFDGSLPAIGYPCPNPEAFEGDGLRLPRPVNG
jgi:LmbE family N-acetylglucosaminyl deacetylase